MTLGWHDLLHGLTAAILLVTGIPILLLAIRASRHRPRRAPLATAGDARGSWWAAITILGIAFALIAATTAIRVDLVNGALLSITAAALGTLALHAVRHARFSGVLTIPLIGLVGMATLLAIAGPQQTTPHEHAHSTMTAR